jgi:hypothetical protein
MKRRSRAAIASTPAATNALFVHSGGAKAEWAATVTAGPAVVARRTWSADATTAKAAELAARSVRVSARPTDDGKYAKYTAGGFVLVTADDGVDVSNAGAVQGIRGAVGHSPVGAPGASPVGNTGSGINTGAAGFKPQGEQGRSGFSPQGANGGPGRVENGLAGNLGNPGSVRPALVAKSLFDAVVTSTSGLFAARTAAGAMPGWHTISAQAYDLTFSTTLLAYGVASQATSLTWTVHVLVGAVYVLVDQRASQACPTSTYREYTLAATPPGCTAFRITFNTITGGTSSALVSVLGFA